MATLLQVRTIEKGRVKVHCCSSPDDGERVNAQIIETPNRLVLVDAMLLRPYARELRQLVEAIGKPIDRVLVTHAHPDHWFGLEFFQDQEVFAFPETVAEIQAFAPLAIGFHRGQLGEAVTDRAWLPNREAVEGDQVIDGIAFRVIKVLNAEDVTMLALVLPEEKILVAQDLVYHQVHLFVGQRSLDGVHCHDGWIRALEGFQRDGYELILPGHGLPAGAELLEANLQYLRTAKAILADASREDFVPRTLAAFPDHELRSMVDMSAFFLFSTP